MTTRSRRIGRALRGVAFLLLGGCVGGAAIAQIPLQTGACKDASACQSSDLEGHWEGVITVRPAEFELDFSVDLLQAPNGSWMGRIVVPPMDWDFPVENVKLEGTQLSFDYHTEEEAMSFSGELVDGTFRGQWTRPDRTAPFAMRRIDTAGSALPPLQALPGGLKDFAARFNEDRDKVRLVLLLSPT